MALPTMLDLAIANGSDMSIGLIAEGSKAVPEISGKIMFRGAELTIPNLGASRTIKGTDYKTLVRTALGTAAFRSANNGSVAIKSTYENRQVSTYIMNPRWECDKAIADQYEDGPEKFIGLAAADIMEAALITLGKQFYYGRTTADAAGHPGLIDSVLSTMTIDAGGTTASTGSSVWGVKFGERDVQWVFGENGSLEVSEVRIGDITGANDITLTGYIQELLAFVGVQVGSIESIGRIKKLTADSGKGLTDALMGQLRSSFLAHKQPDCFLMSRRSLEQLRASRTATSPTGMEAATPTDFEGIPIVPTDSILNTEALTL